MTFGYELELGDVRRDRAVPERFGTWEYAETDIVNLRPPYQYVATDPLGKEPPVGGEINIRPGETPGEVADRVSETIEWFRGQGDTPTASCVNHGHVHVRVLGLRDDIRKLKRLTSWVVRNQDYMIRQLYGYQETVDMQFTKTARTYLKWDGGRPMPEWMGWNIIDLAQSFDDFIRIQCCGKNGVSMGRPLRYAVNTYCMKHTDTIEFRLYRASLSHAEIEGSLELARLFVEAALNDGPDARDILTIGAGADLVHPNFYYDHQEYLGWERTKWDKARGKKERRLIEI